MAADITLLKSFVDGQGAGAATYVNYDSDLDTNLVDIENAINALNAEFRAFAGANASIAIDLATSSSPSVLEGFIGTDSFAPVSFLTADTQIQIPAGVALTAEVGRVETAQTFTFTGTGSSGSRFFALQENGTVTQETAGGLGVLDLYSVNWNGSTFDTGTLARLPTAGGVIVDGDDFQNAKIQEDFSQGTDAVIPAFTYDRLQYRLDDALRIMMGLPTAGLQSSSQVAGSGAPAGPSLKPIAIGGAAAAPGLIVGNPSDGYAATTGLFGDPSASALGVSVEGIQAALFDLITASEPQQLQRAGTNLGAPPYSFAGDPDSGVGWVSANRWRLIANGAEVAQARGDLAIPALKGNVTWSHLVESVKTGTTYTQVADDEGTAIVGNNGSGITVSLLPAATAGDGYVFVAKNIGAGTMTLDPDGAEQIEGAATFDLATDESAIVWCNGSQWRAITGGGGGGGSDSGEWFELPESVKTGSSYAQVAADDGTAIVGNNATAITIDLLAAATAGAGYVFIAKNIGLGDMTLDPDSSELIEGETTLILGTGESAVVWCNGSEWRALISRLTNSNLLINGDMRFAQRGASGSAVFDTTGTFTNNDDSYLLDQWILLSDGNNIVDVSQQSSDLPAGASHAMRMDVETANLKFGTVQILEADQSVALRNRKVTFSGYAQADSSIGDVHVAVLSWNGTADSVTSDVVSAWGAGGADPTLATNWANAETPTDIGIGTSWARFSVTVDVPNDCNNLAVFVYSVDTSTTIGHFLEITNLKLEVGPHPTRYEMRSASEELHLCQRFFAKTFRQPTKPVEGAGTTGTIIGKGNTNTENTEPLANWFLPAVMRAVPTVTLFNPRSGGTSGEWQIGPSSDSTAARVISTSHTLVVVDNTGTPVTAGDQAFIHVTAEAVL